MKPPLLGILIINIVLFVSLITGSFHEIETSWIPRLCGSGSARNNRQNLKDRTTWPVFKIRRSTGLRKSSSPDGKSLRSQKRFTNARAGLALAARSRDRREEEAGREIGNKSGRELGGESCSDFLLIERSGARSALTRSRTCVLIFTLMTDVKLDPGSRMRSRGAADRGRTDRPIDRSFDQRRGQRIMREREKKTEERKRNGRRQIYIHGRGQETLFRPSLGKTASTKGKATSNRTVIPRATFFTRFRDQSATLAASRYRRHNFVCIF